MKSVFFRIFLVTIFLSGARTFADNAEKKGSVLLYGEGAGALDASYLAGLFLSPPGAAYNIAHRIEERSPKPDEFGEAAVVLVASLNDKAAQPWTAEETATAEAWVASGGTLVFLGNSPVLLAESSSRLGRLAPLLGATQLQSPDGPQRVAGDSPITEGLTDEPWMAPGGWAGSGLTTARPLLTDGQTAMAMGNSLGDGQVFFFGRDVSRLNPSTGIQSYAQMIGRAILDGNVLKTASLREPWVLKALGPEISPTRETPPQRQTLKSTVQVTKASGAAVGLVKDGVADAVIIVGTTPSRTAAKAAQTLRQELLRLTGADLAVAKESTLEVSPSEEGTRIQTPDGKTHASAIVIGDTDIGKSLGVTSDDLPLEGYRMVTRGNLLFLCGSDRRPDGFELEGSNFAVSALLERHCGVRWLWPGELGSVYPETKTLAIGPLDETDAPALRIRKLRDTGGSKRFETDTDTGEVRAIGAGRSTGRSMKLLGRDLETQVKRHSEAGPWFEHMRLGQSYLAGASHAFSGWWDRYGAQHIDWFSLQPTGFRQQRPPREQFCQSSPALVDAIARATVQKFQEDPRRDVVSIAQNDVGVNSYCFCEACRKKDPVNAKPALVRYLIGNVSTFASYPALSDRMVGFFGEIAEAVKRQRPGAKVGVTAYNAYRSAPLAARLPENSLLVFVGTNYFNSEVLASDRDNWDRWASHAPEMILRPNTLHQGHALPAVFVKGISQDLKHGYQTGMIGADYDSIVHHWATQGLNYYVLAKLLWDPSLDPEAIVQDYCAKGFGPAAGSIREYFAALESHTREVSEKMGELTRDTLRENEADEVDTPYGAEFFIKRIPEFYPTEKIAEWRALLQKARGAATGDEKVLARIAFLEEGLVYATWQHDFFKALEESSGQKAELPEIARKRRQDFQRMFDENYFAIQFGSALWREEFFWKQTGLTTSQ